MTVKPQSSSSALEALPFLRPRPLSLSLFSTTLELIKLRDELDCCDIPATFFYTKFIVTRALFFFHPPPTLIFLWLFPCLFSLSLIKPGRSSQQLELSASWGGELLGADNNTKWIFSNREKQLSPLFECFTFPRSINWLFDHRQRCTVTDKE